MISYRVYSYRISESISYVVIHIIGRNEYRNSFFMPYVVIPDRQTDNTCYLKTKQNYVGDVHESTVYMNLVIPKYAREKNKVIW